MDLGIHSWLHRWQRQPSLVSFIFAIPSDLSSIHVVSDQSAVMLSINLFVEFQLHQLFSPALETIEPESAEVQLRIVWIDLELAA